MNCGDCVEACVNVVAILACVKKRIHPIRKPGQTDETDLKLLSVVQRNMYRYHTICWLFLWLQVHIERLEEMGNYNTVNERTSCENDAEFSIHMWYVGLHNYSRLCMCVWVWNLVSHGKGETWIKGLGTGYWGENLVKRRESHWMLLGWSDKGGYMYEAGSTHRKDVKCVRNLSRKPEGKRKL
jgi:hypothetical protein